MVASGVAVAAERVEAPAELRLALRRRRAAERESAGAGCGAQRCDPIAEVEPQAAQELARAQRPFEVAVEPEVARDPGSAEPNQVRSGRDVGEGAGIADDDRVAAALRLRPQLALVPEAHREGEAAREAALEPRRERREAIRYTAGALHPPLQRSRSSQQGRCSGTPSQSVLPEALMLAIRSGHQGPRTENAAYRRPPNSLSWDWSALNRFAAIVVEFPPI